jgi:hypothetical protein
MNPFARLLRWLRLEDYRDAQRQVDRKIVARFARGNERMQAGAYMTETELVEKSLAADAALARINNRISK